MGQTVNCRALAYEILIDVARHGRSFNPQLVSKRYPSLDARNQAFTVHLCFGVLRFYFVLQSALNLLLDKPLKEKDKDLQLLLMIGLYQLFYTDIPHHASIHATVEACKRIAPFAKGLINGVLRNALRLDAKVKHCLDKSASHPAWLEKRWQHQWPQYWQTLLEANQQHPPFVLRVNQRKMNREDYLALLNKENIPANILEHAAMGIEIAEDVPIQRLPGFLEGLVSVQDGSAQLAATLLELTPKLRVLDACAAPGGKTAHMLELEPSLEVVALEKEAPRVHLLKSTLERLALPATVLCADASSPNDWWDQQLFDRILLDAPCSATGVIRRHPDIKLHRQESDLKQLTKLQADLLSQLWPLLKPGGILLYATCSTLAAENEEQISQFLATQQDAAVLPIEASWGITQAAGRQILPGQDGMDGFYYARLIKCA
ncbi:16S rRNA (cytosine(967)-C(5))-methyltransferase RsmB [Candidatus Berkiella aquae]|uniref:16S rRNA (cytosine(967)-C(5))-methyltransferase n=1 Tax=Candidatus Berkiella aquae TaxID=295108 RepID=A0A0Q9YYE1_9GAMM|nr:16S rRNA (cytosine(967)-C(5))-methyltransferase RsmB [Candidatus Berkiella aquae]MCS5709810.1 16S rRNA (cytosine(967)-C(5))-methyltransferase RsmB [Candidatus Berkiella aquae]